MSNIKDLLLQRDKLRADLVSIEADIHAVQAGQRNDAISQVKTLMSQSGLTVSDLGLSVPAKPSKRQPAEENRPKVAAKYRDDATGQAWSGRGLKPKWLTAQIAAGKTLEDFAISK